jgi:hypothetical protein
VSVFHQYFNMAGFSYQWSSLLTDFHRRIHFFEVPIFRLRPPFSINDAPWELPVLGVFVVHPCKNASAEHRRGGIHFLPHALERSTPVVTDTWISQVFLNTLRVHVVEFCEEDRPVPIGVTAEVEDRIMGRI